MFITSMKLDIPQCIIDPNLDKMQQSFNMVSVFLIFYKKLFIIIYFIFQTIQNVVETFYAVTTWGKQAKTRARKLKKPLIGIFIYYSNVSKFI